MWYSLLGKKVILSLNACASDQFYIASLVWTRDIFPVKHNTRRNRQNIYSTSMKARDVKNEKQMKLQEKEVNYYVWKKNKRAVHNIRAIVLSTKNKCRVTNIYTYYILLREKTKISYYITFFQTLLKTFSCGLCYSESRNSLGSEFVIHFFLRENESELLCLKKKIFLSTNSRSTCIILQISKL